MFSVHGGIDNRDGGILITPLCLLPSSQCSTTPTGGPATEQPEGLGPDNGEDRRGIIRSGNFRQMQEPASEG